MISSTDVGWSVKAIPCRPARRSSPLPPSMPPTKEMRSLVRGSSMPARARAPCLGEGRHRGRLRVLPHVGDLSHVAQRIPRAVGVQPEVAPLGGLHCRLLGLAHDKVGLRERGEQLLGCQAVVVMHQAVVGQHRELARGKEHREEGVGGMLPATAPSLAALMAVCGGRGGTVVAVGYIGAGHGGEGDGERLDRRAARYAPDGLAHALLVGEVVEGLGHARGVHDDVDGHAVAVREEHRAGLCPGRAYVLRAIGGLLRPRLLVAVDGAVLVLGHGAGADDAHLATPPARGDRGRGRAPGP